MIDERLRRLGMKPAMATLLALTFFGSLRLSMAATDR
jgi:hypothetical protein